MGETGAGGHECFMSIVLRKVKHHFYFVQHKKSLAQKTAKHHTYPGLIDTFISSSYYALHKNALVADGLY